MIDFWKLITTEVNPVLSDQRNTVIEELVSKQFLINDCLVTFRSCDHFFYNGNATFSNDDISMDTLYSVYISGEFIFISLFTLDLIKLLDTPYNTLASELELLLKNNFNLKNHKL